MNADMIGGAIGIVGSMVLVGSALVARRTSFRGRGPAMALAWVAILAVLIALGLWIDGHR